MATPTTIDDRLRILEKYQKLFAESDLFDDEDAAQLKGTIDAQKHSKIAEFEKKCNDRLVLLKQLDVEIDGLRAHYPELNSFFVNKQKKMQQQLDTLNKN